MQHIRLVVLIVCLIILFVYVIHLDLLGIWLGLCIGRALASIINYIFARYEVKRTRAEFGN